MMTKTGENFQIDSFQKTVIDAHAPNSSGAVSIFFGKTSIEKVKEIVRKRHSSFPGQYPHEDTTQDYTSPGSVGKKAAFFDQYIRCSSLEKTADTLGCNNAGGKSDNGINFAGSKEKSESITKEKYKDHASDLSKDLMFSTAGESVSKDTKLASLAHDSASSIDVYRVEEKKTLQHIIGNENVPVAEYSLNSTVSPADSAHEVRSFEASHKHRNNKDNLNKNVSKITLENEAVQLEGHFIRVSMLGEECGEQDARKSFTNGTQGKSFSDHKQEKSDNGYSASTESSQDMLKDSLQPKRTSSSFKKDQQSKLAVNKASLTSTSANFNLHKKEVNDAPATTRTAVPVSCSKTHVKVSSLAKGPAESQPSKLIIEAGNIRTSADLHKKHKEITQTVSRTTCIKPSSHGINGRLLKVKDCQQIPGRGISYKDAENTEKGKEEKFDHEIKEMRRRFMSTKAPAQQTSYKEPKSGFKKNDFISTRSPKPVKICIDEPKKQAQK